MPKLHPLIKLDKDVAEGIFGHEPGRPTISRRFGRGIASAIAVHEDTGTHLFHLGLLAVAATVAAKSMSKPKPAPVSTAQQPVATWPPPRGSYPPHF